MYEQQSLTDLWTAYWRTCTRYKMKRRKLEVYLQVHAQGTAIGGWQRAEEATKSTGYQETLVVVGSQVW